MSANQLFDELYYIIWSYVCQWADFFEPSSPAKYLNWVVASKVWKFQTWMGFESSAMQCSRLVELSDQLIKPLNLYIYIW